MEIRRCGDAPCGEVVWLRHPFGGHGCALRDAESPDPDLRGRPLVGLEILRDLQASPEDPGRPVASRARIEAQRDPIGVGAVADLDGDTLPDVVTANYSTNDVSVLLGNGDGSFQSAVSYAAGTKPLSIAVADLDGDSVPDLVTANQYILNQVGVLLGNGDGSFQAPVSYAAGDVPASVAAADLDGDGVSDLVTANEFGHDVSVLLGNGDGSFQAAVHHAVGTSPSFVAVADLDGDSFPDLVTGTSPCCSGWYVIVQLGKGDGTFEPSLSYPVAYPVAVDGPASVAIADLDGAPPPMSQRRTPRATTRWSSSTSPSGWQRSRRSCPGGSSC